MFQCCRLNTLCGITVRIALIILAVLAVSIFTKTYYTHDTLASDTDEIERRFPSVSHISIVEVAPLLMSNQNLEQVLLLDSRTQDEYAVSHIPGALLYRDSTELREKIQRTSESRLPVIIYCSVGYRSSELAEQLAADGLDSVYSLRGGIFEWANRGLPLDSTHAERVREVHPFNSTWGRYLRPELRAKMLK